MSCGRRRSSASERSPSWKRPPAEVGRLFWLLREYCRRETAELIQNGVRVTHLGRRDRIPAGALAELDRTMERTAAGTQLHLRLAIDYGARWALTDAVQRLAADAVDGQLDPATITPDLLRHALSNGVPDPDLIVRTAGEQRLSDFMLWEGAYAELYFTDVLWPDFRQADLALAVSEFGRRERRFGGVPAATPTPRSLAN
jgi:undecaprenyl diphosphate synthase